MKTLPPPTRHHDIEGCSCCVPSIFPEAWAKEDPGERLLVCNACLRPLGLIHDRARLVYTETASREGCAWWAWPSLASGSAAEAGEAGTWTEARDAVVVVLLGASP